MSVATPTDLWNEDGDRVWLPYGSCENAGEARHKAWSGAGLPVGFKEMGAELIELRVRVVWAREAPDSEWDEFPWKRCAASDPGATKFWEVS